MFHHYRTGMALALAGVALALSGCAAMEGTTTAQAGTPTSTMGSRASGFMQAGFEPFSLSNCMKFEALPYECEGTVRRGE